MNPLLCIVVVYCYDDIGVARGCRLRARAASGEEKNWGGA